MERHSTSGLVVLRVRGILFDMDGVLVSSLGSVERTWEKWAKARGIDPETAIRTAHGCRAIETVQRLRPDLDAMQELAWLEEMEIADKVGIEMLAGVKPILEVLPADRWIVVTSATGKIAKSRLAHGGVPATARVVTADEVRNGKPHPEPYEKGAAMLGLKPEECLVIEDSASGAKAGHAAGCKVLATLHSHSLESLTHADWVVESLEGVRVRMDGDRIEVRFVPVSTNAVREAASTLS